MVAAGLGIVRGSDREAQISRDDVFGQPTVEGGAQCVDLVGPNRHAKPPSNGLQLLQRNGHQASVDR